MTGIYIGTSPLKEAYVGTTPVKEIYVGTTKVRPTIQEFYYDFIAAGSVAQMQSDGWSFGRQSGTATSGWEFTSNGLHNTDTGSSSKFGGIHKAHGLNMSNAQKITIIANVYISRGSWNGASSFGITDASAYGGGTYGAGGCVNSMYNSGYNGYAVYAGSNNNWNRTSVSTNSYTVTVTLDLVNKTATTNLPGYTDRTISLSDSDVSSIRTLQYTNLGFDNVGCYYKNLKIIVE